MQGLIPEAYIPFAQPIFEAFAKPAATTKESDVAEVVWEAAHDSSERLRFAAGADAVALAQAHRSEGLPSRRDPCGEDLGA